MFFENQIDILQIYLFIHMDKNIPEAGHVLAAAPLAMSLNDLFSEEKFEGWLKIEIFLPDGDPEFVVPSRIFFKNQFSVFDDLIF